MSSLLKETLAVYNKRLKLLWWLSLSYHHHVYHSISFIFNYPENDFSNTIGGCARVGESSVCAVTFQRGKFAALGKSTCEMSGIHSTAVESDFKSLFLLHKTLCVTEHPKAPRLSFFSRREKFRRCTTTVAGRNNVIPTRTALRVLEFLSRSQHFPGDMCGDKRWENFQLCFGSAGGIIKTDFYFVKINL